MNRRGFLGFLGVAPVAAVASVPEAEQAAMFTIRENMVVQLNQTSDNGSHSHTITGGISANHTHSLTVETPNVQHS